MCYKDGCLRRACQQISYDSTTSSLSFLYNSSTSTAQTAGEKTNISSSQDLSQSRSDKKLTDALQKMLRDGITNCGFFQANGNYPPNPAGAQDFILDVMGITMDDESQTVIWADTASNVPTGVPCVVKIM
jgi:hypothetical protein